jgi:hypothetical protein
MQTYDKLVEKWAPILNEESAGTIQDNHRRQVTAAVLENQEKALAEQTQQLNEYGTSVGGGDVANWNPVLIALVRRAMPNLMAYDVCGVQPMSGPTGLIFAMKSKYKTTRSTNGVTSGDEALFDEAKTGYSGDSTASQSIEPSGLDGLTDAAPSDSSIGDSAVNRPDFGTGMTTAQAELLGGAEPNCYS